MDTIKPHISNQYINKIVNDFYNNVLKNILVSIYNKSITNKSNGEQQQSLNIMDALYLELYNNYGIKRKIIGDDAVMFNYSKNHPKYSKTSDIINLFRSIIINPNTMEIVSMGIPKSNSEIIVDDINPVDFSNIVFENFNYGTMIIYNKDKTFYSGNSNDDDDTTETTTEIDASISTRTKIGTSNFNTDFSHRFYFEQNNLSNPKNVIDLSEIPDTFKNCSFVFNMTHKREHLTNVSMNTLVACYKFNPELSSIRCNAWNSIIELLKNLDNSFEEKMVEYLKIISHDMIVSLDINDIQEHLVKAGVGYITSPTKYSFSSLEEVKQFINTLPITDQGVILWLPDGRRTKMRNSKFMYVKSLCMNCSINPSPFNQKNLFKMYCELNKINKVPEFLKYYETPDYRYNFIFNYFHYRINTMINHLFQVYQQLHVFKKMTNEMVPKFMKPLCYALHGLYLEDKKPITKERIINYIYNMNCGMLYGRIFTPMI